MHHASKDMNFKNARQKLKEELLGRREELTRIDIDDYTNQEFDRLIIRNSISKHISYIVCSTVAAIVLLLPNNEGELNLVQLVRTNWFFAIIVGAIPLTLMYLGIEGVIDRSPKLIVDTKGISAKDWQLGWDEITETKFRFDQGKTTLLVVKTATMEKEIDIGNTNVGSRFLGHHIELLKKRYR